MSAYLGNTPVNVLNVLFRNKEAVALYRGSTLLQDFGSSEFSPLDLFAGGKQGVFYDPSDKSTLFQDIAGTVPVIKDGDPVALMKDKSGSGNHATQTVSTARPVYKTNGVLHWLSFDGVDDYLSTPAMQSSHPFSLACAAETFSSSALLRSIDTTSYVRNHNSFGVQFYFGTNFKYSNAVSGRNVYLTIAKGVSSQFEVTPSGNGVITGEAGNGAYSSGMLIGANSTTILTKSDFYGICYVDNEVSISTYSDLRRYMLLKIGVTL